MSTQQFENMHWAGSIFKRNGAWLVSAHDPTGDATPDEMYDCAANMPMAKKLLREMSDAFGFGGRSRWEKRDQGGRYWSLYRDRDYNDERLAALEADG